MRTNAKSLLGSWAGRAVMLTLLVLALSATAAVAANLNGGNADNTIIGTTGNDNITDGNGNDSIWGLGGSDSIHVGYGNDTIDAGGSCPSGSQGTISSGKGGSYCQHGPHGTCGPDNISIAAGSGNDVVYFNCGQNSLSQGKGQGNTTLYAYGGANTVNLSNGDDKIYAGKGYETAGSNFATGSGNDVIYAQNGFVDTINCGSRATVVYADRNDKTSGCTVKYTSPAHDVAVAPHHRVHRSLTRRHK